jgi:hypothetical protein
MVKVAAPLVERTVRRRFSSARSATAQDFEDVCADALCAILIRLHRHYESGPEIEDFESYAASVASNTADRFFAARAPQRARLRNRIRYVLSTDRRFVFGESEAGLWMCGVRDRGGLARFFGKLSPHRLPNLLHEILTAAGGSIELSELTTQAAHALGVTDRVESADDYADRLRDPRVLFAHTAELKDWLRRLWMEVCELPLPQRMALLLNMGSAAENQGGASLCSIADLGIAGFPAIAATLDMTVAELAAIWNEVPLEDHEIARTLRLERQQVINLRASARKRLARRMAAIDRIQPVGNMKAQSDTRESDG